MFLVALIDKLGLNCRAKGIFYVVGILFGIVAIVSMVKSWMPVKVLGVPIQSESTQNCPRGTWSPTLKICVEEVPQEESRQREGDHRRVKPVPAGARRWNRVSRIEEGSTL